MSLKALKEGLVALGVPVYRYHAPDNTSPEYIVWAEDGRDDFEADNRHSELVAEGTIDLYTHDGDSALPRGIEQVLEDTAAAWHYSSTQYEEETGLIHREWVWQVPMEVG